jgi:hypothetical protein
VNLNSQQNLAAFTLRAATDPGGENRTTQHFEQLVGELRPHGIAEQLLVVQLARSAAQLEENAAAANSWRQLAAAALAAFAVPGITGIAPSEDQLARGLPCRAADRAQRQMLAHSRVFARTLQAFWKVRALRTTFGGPATEIDRVPFRTEQQCANYLAGWQRRHFCCTHCGARAAYFISARACLECVACRAQRGLRSGTVMASSALPLQTWFRAIWLLSNQPMACPAQAQVTLGLRRRGTVRKVVGKVRSALKCDDRDQLLAGLPEIFRDFAGPEASVSVRIVQAPPPGSRQATWQSQQAIAGAAVARTTQRNECLPDLS